MINEHDPTISPNLDTLGESARLNKPENLPGGFPNYNLQSNHPYGSYLANGMDNPAQAGPPSFGASPPERGPQRPASSGNSGSRGRARRRISAWMVVLCFFCAFLGAGVGGATVYTIYKDNLAQSPAANNGALQQPTASVSQPPSATQGNESVVEPVSSTLSIAQIAGKASPAVVSINSTIRGSSGFSQNIQGTSAGSGVIISADGYIVTNNHVVVGASAIQVVLSDETEHTASVVGTDAETDIAVLKIQGDAFPYIELGNSSELKVGDLAVVIGNPLGELSGTVTSGIISALNREVTVEGTTMTLLQTDAAVNQGNSGGALLNSQGDLVGIVNAKTSAVGVEGLAYAIPIDLAKPIVEELKISGYVTGRPLMGVTIQTIYSRDSIIPGLGSSEQSTSVYVTSVISGSAADKAGIQAEDIIIAIEGEPVYTTDDVDAVKNQYTAGDSVEVTLLRNNQEIAVTLIFDENVPDYSQ
ncbi:MAG: S1C family serine protease [Christensenellales bacterium]|jgi:serine protease Do